MRPKSNGSSTIGMKKSVVAMIACWSFRRYTAASSLVSLPTSRSGNGNFSFASPRMDCNSAGAILQPQPPPCDNWVNFTLDTSRSLFSMLFRTANLSQLGEFDEIIDVRTPAEFAEDHIPGAINCPVLSDEERITVGTLYKQVSPFEARKAGAALVAKNIAHHLQTRFHDRPKSWRPLIYCWRGGQRSGAMSIILSQVGWAAHKLEGGYKTYRREVLDKLEALPRNFAFLVICGATGSGKSRLLNALADSGQQVLDLEMLSAKAFSRRL